MKKIVLPPERGNLWSGFDWKANRGPENQQGREGCDDRVFATHEKKMLATKYGAKIKQRK